MISILSSKAAPSKVVDGATKSREVFCLVGLSSDTKPTTSYKGILICNGSVYDEIDTGKEYLYDEAGGEWHEQPEGDKKKDDPTAEEISVSRGSADAGKVIVVGNNGKLLPVELEVGEGEVAIDGTLKIPGAAADAKKTGDAIASLNGSLNTLTGIMPVDTASGGIASFSDGANDMPVKSLTVVVTAVQSGSGDPSPENVRPISGWTGVSIKRTGKNLFGGSILKAKLLSIGGSDQGDNIGVGSGNLSGKILFDTIFKENTQYTLILDVKKPSGNTNSNVCIYYTDGSSSNIFLSNEITKRQTLVVHSTSGKTINKIVGINASAGTWFYFDTCGLFEGVLTESDFVPYQGNTINIDWTNEAGEVYGGTLNVTTGLLTVDRKLYTVNAISTVTASYIKSDAINGYITNSEIYPVSGYNKQPELLCDKLTPAKANIWERTGYTNCFSINANQIHINISNDLLGITDYTEETTATAKEKLNAWLAENPVTLTIPIAETTYQLTAQEVTTLLGDNTIYADTGDVSVTYRADSTLYVNRKIAEAISALS